MKELISQRGDEISCRKRRAHHNTYFNEERMEIVSIPSERALQEVLPLKTLSHFVGFFPQRRFGRSHVGSPRIFFKCLEFTELDTALLLGSWIITKEKKAGVICVPCVFSWPCRGRRQLLLALGPPAAGARDCAGETLLSVE